MVKAPQPVGPLAVPLYPRTVPTGSPILIIVGMRITVDKQGRVSDARPSPFAFSTPTPYAEEFHAAVLAATSLWRFEPARIQRAESGRNEQGQGVLMLSPMETTEWVFDVSFTFTGNGKVVTGAAPRPLE